MIRHESSCVACGRDDCASCPRSGFEDVYYCDACGEEYDDSDPMYEFEGKHYHLSCLLEKLRKDGYIRPIEL